MGDARRYFRIDVTGDQLESVFFLTGKQHEYLKSVLPDRRNG